MSKGAQLHVSKTKSIPDPNAYVQAMYGEYRKWAFDEEKSITFIGQWRSELGVSADHPVDLEIGTGNGFHFGHQALTHPQRCLIGIELKYKPLIQSIRRVIKGGGTNARMCRYNARLVSQLFANEEINDVFIHFPDPWEKLNRNKHRLIQDEFLKDLHQSQKSGSRVFFKTDSRDYFDWSLERFVRGPYQMEGHSFDLHKSEWAESNFVTHFERLFLHKGQPIHYAQMVKT